MKRKRIIIGGFVAVVVIGWLVSASRQARPSIFFSQPQAQWAKSMADYSPVSFYVTNTGSRPAYLSVTAIQTNSGSVWIADTRAMRTNTSSSFGKGTVLPREAVQLSFTLPPQVASPARLRVMVQRNASIATKARFAWSRLRANRAQGKSQQLWIDNLVVPDYEVFTPEIP